MWFAYTENFANWHVLNIEQVREIVAENKQGVKVSSLEDYAIETVVEPEKDFNNAMGQESLTRFDQPKRNKNRNKNKVSNQNQSQGQSQGKIKPQEQEQGQNQNQKPPHKKPIIIKKNENKE